MTVNQFTFECPVFHAKTKIAACWELRELYARAERPAVRKGCQVALECGKCPMTAIMWKNVRSGKDPYIAADDSVRKISDDILERISPVLIRHEVMRKYDLSPAEHQKLTEANASAGKFVASKRTRSTQTAKMEDVPVEAAKPATPKADFTAAATGDMAAAINAELEQRK